MFCCLGTAAGACTLTLRYAGAGTIQCATRRVREETGKLV